MTASARFLFFLMALTLIGCSSGEKPATESGTAKQPDASSSANQDSDKKMTSDSPEASAASTEKLELDPTPTLDPDKQFSNDLSGAADMLSQPSLPEGSLAEGAPNQADSVASSIAPSTDTESAASLMDHVVSSSPETPGDVVSNEPTSADPALAEPKPAGLSAEPAPAALTPMVPYGGSTSSDVPSPPATSQEQENGNPLRDGSVPDTVRPVTEGQDPAAVPVSPQGSGVKTEGGPVGALPDGNITSPSNALPSNSKMSLKGKPNSKGEVFDPIKENGPIFVDWPKPELTLVMTGRQNGYIEPCGCAGLERMKGGLTRRDSFLQDLIQKRKWPVVAVDVGNQVKGHKRQTELKFQHTAEALSAMGYDGVGLGITDLQLPAGELASVTSNENSPFVSANIDLFEPGTELIERYKIVERNGIKVGITAVLSDSFRKQLNDKSIPTTDPVAAIEQVVGKLKECEVRVLLAFANKEESIALAKRFPMFNVVVTSDGGSEPPNKSAVIPNTNTYLVQVGEKGICAVVLGIYRDKETPVRYQRVPLDSRFATSERIHRLMGAYQEQLRMLGLEGLKIKPVPAPETRTKGKYIGSKACATCHEQSYDIWRKSKHAQAWKTLVEASPPRNHDPECISCHVVGWDPQHYYPFVGGFISPKKTHELENVGCESCHGPGGAHAEAEEGSDLALQERLQKAMIVTLEESRSDPQKMCYNCHDLDNSPEFDFDKYWPEVKHYETDSGEKEDDE